MSPVLRTHALAVGHGGVEIVTAMDLTVEPGTVVAVLGRNGAGKTTTLSTIAGTVAPISGQIEMLGAPLGGPLHTRVRAGLQVVMEDRTVIRNLSVDENIRLAGVDRGRVMELFPELARLGGRKAGLLSGGEQQMLALGRAIAAQPKLLLIDELSLGLAPQIVRRLLQSVRAAADGGVAVMLVEQYARLALTVADYGYVLGRGRIAIEGSGAELRRRVDEVEGAYLA